MPTITSSEVFFGGTSSLGGYCQMTYTASAGTISITALAFCGNSASVSAGAYYGYSQTFTMYCGSQSRSCTVSTVRCNSSSYVDAGFSGATFTSAYGSQTISFTVRGRSSSPYDLTFSFTINGGYGDPSVSISSTSATTTTISATCTGSAGSGASSITYTWTLNGGSSRTGSSVSWTGLSPATTYTLVVTGTSSSGLTASANTTVTTSTPSAPTYSVAFSNTTSTSTRMTVTMSSNPDSWWKINYYAANSTTVSGSVLSGSTGSSNITYSGLSHNTQYNMRTRYISINDTNGGTIQSNYVTTSGDAPTITSYGVTTYGQTSMEMYWSATYDTNSSLSSYRWDYTTGTIPSGVSEATDPMAYGTNTITGLEPNTTYNYRLVVVESFAQRTSSVTGSFKTDYPTQEITSIQRGAVSYNSITAIITVPNPDWLNSLTIWLYEEDGTTLVTSRTLTTIEEVNNVLFEDLDSGATYIVKAQTNTYSQTASVGGYDSEIVELDFTTPDERPVAIIQSDGTITKHKAYVMGTGDIYNPRRMDWQNGYYATGTVGDSISSLLTQSITGSSACTTGYVTIIPAISYTIVNEETDVNYIIHGADINNTVTSTGYVLSPGASYEYIGSTDTVRLYISIEATENEVINSSTAPYFQMKIYRTVQRTEIPQENFVYINGKIRYIDIVQAGNTIDNNSYINGLEVYTDSGENIALGASVTAVKGDNATNLEVITDGAVSATKYATIEPTSTEDLQTIVRVDLGQEYTNIEALTVWRYWSDGRAFHQTNVYGRDESGQLTWKFQSYKHGGEYIETEDGYTGRVYYQEIMSFPLIASVVLDPPNTQGTANGTNIIIDADWVTYIPPVIDSIVSYRTDAILAARQGYILKSEMGELPDLATTAKDSIVEAINEIAESWGDMVGYKNILDAMLNMNFVV